MIERYATKEMTEIWNDTNKIKCWIQIEMSVLNALSSLCDFDSVDQIPSIFLQDTNNIFEIKGISKQKIDIYLPEFMEQWYAEEAKTHHDIAAFVNVLERNINADCSRFLHYGITSSDLCDTEFALRIKQSIGIIKSNVMILRGQLYKLAEKYIDTPIMGRTHGMLAEPTTLGLVFGIYVAELDRHIERINEIEKRICVGKISGCVGTYAHIKPEIEQMVLNNLDLEIPKITNQIVQRDRHAELFNLLALIAATLEKFALQIRLYSRSEVGEMAEPFGSKQKGSSSMPHKRNPIKCENICGLSRLMRGYASAAMENIALWHERDISHSSAERFIAPDAFGVLNFMLSRMQSIVEGLNVDTNAMENRTNFNQDLWESQFTMLAAICSGMSRKEAHDKTQSKELKNNSDIDLVKYHTRYARNILKRVNYVEEPIDDLE